MFVALISLMQCSLLKVGPGYFPGELQNIVLWAAAQFIQGYRLERVYSFTVRMMWSSWLSGEPQATAPSGRLRLPAKPKLATGPVSIPARRRRPRRAPRHTQYPGLGSRQVHQHGLRALAAGAVARAVGHVEADEELLAGVSGHRPTIQAFVLDPFGNQLPRA